VSGVMKGGQRVVKRRWWRQTRDSRAGSGGGAGEKGGARDGGTADGMDD
jgi:hypothetical protein